MEMVDCKIYQIPWLGKVSHLWVVTFVERPPHLSTENKTLSKALPIFALSRFFKYLLLSCGHQLASHLKKKNEDLGNLSIDKSTFKSTMSHDRTWRPFWRQLHFVFSFLKGILGPRSSLSTQEYYEVISDLRWLYTTQHHLKLSTMQGHIKKGAETQVWPCVRRAFTESWEAHVQNVYKEGPKIFAHLHLEQLFMICVVHTQVSLQWYAAEVKP